MLSGKTIALLVLVVFNTVSGYTPNGRHLTYSFRVPSQWGQSTAETAGCCPYLEYPSNLTSVNKRLPNFMGLGVQKSGSTTLSWYLASHPDFALSRTKETHFMDKDYDWRTLTVYERQWSGKKAKAPIKFEFTPSYFWLPFSACRIKKALPEMKFVVILRNPADRAYSEYNMVRQRCHGSNSLCIWKRLDFHKVVKKGLNGLRYRNCTFNNGVGRKTWNDCFRCVGYHPRARPYCHYRPYYFKHKGNVKSCFAFSEQIISRGLYAAQLAWWFSLFPPENFVVILSHDFYSDPVHHLNRVGEVIGAKRKFRKWMLPKKGNGVGMKGKYKYSDLHKEEAKQLLKKFFARPNRELYQLLDSVNHGDYTPFERHLSTYSTASENQTQSVSVSTITHRGPVSVSASVSNEYNNSFQAPGSMFFGLLSVILLLVVVWHLYNNRRESLLNK